MKKSQLATKYNEKELPKRIDKALAWLANSRDKWREKCKEAKLLLKRQTLAVKRLRESRTDHELSTVRIKYESTQSKQEISTLKKRVGELESLVEVYRNENQILKKKQ